MEYRKLSGGGLVVPALSFGTATFGGTTDFFKAWGSTDIKEASRMIDICLDHGANFFDTANVYSSGVSEEILGAALGEKRHSVLIASKASFPMGAGPNDYGSSRQHLIRACEDSLRRLKTDHLDVYYMHGFDALTPIEETLRTLDDLVCSGKVRYIACSNFSGWHLMKSLSVSDRYGWERYSAHQVYYSLMGREYEWELMPLAKEERVSSIIWSPLAGGALTGKISRHHPPAPGTRAAQMDFVVSSKSEKLFDVVDTLASIAREVDKTVTQVALNWVLSKPTVASIVIGARNEAQLIENFGAIGWTLNAEQMERLDQVSATKPIYPYWHQRQFPMLGHV